MKIKEVQSLCSAGCISWTEHVEKRMMQRKISRNQVIRCIMNGEIIEDYPHDYPYPSCLIYGTIGANKVLHVVVSIQGEVTKILNVITTYVPDESRFEADLKTRRRK